MCWRADLIFASLQCASLAQWRVSPLQWTLTGCCWFAFKVMLFSCVHLWIGSQLEVRYGEIAAICHCLSCLMTGSAAGVGEPDRRQMQSLSGFCSPGNSSHLPHCLFCRDLWSYKPKEEGPAKHGSEQSRANSCCNRFQRACFACTKGLSLGCSSNGHRLSSYCLAVLCTIIDFHSATATREVAKVQTGLDD